MTGALEFRVIESWVRAPRWVWVRLRPGRCPPRDQRKGTRRAWKRAHPSGLRQRLMMVAIEPDGMLIAGSLVYCTQAQYDAVKAELARRSGPEGISVGLAP